MKRSTKHNLLLFGLVALLVSASCNSNLDIVPEGAPSKGNFWQTQEDAVKGTNAMYANYDNEDFYGRGLFWYINASDDMVTGRSNAQGENIKNFNNSFVNGSYTSTQWSLRYSTIKRANDVLRYVPEIEMDATLKQHILGDAYFTIGLMYFQLASNYADASAGVPLVTLENMDNPDATPRAANIEENYEYVEDAWKRAATLLPMFEDMAPADYGKPHKVAAWSYLSKLYLYRNDYANAALYADSVINFGNRQLLGQFEDVFTAANNWTSEYIWSAYSTPLGQGGWGSILPGVLLSNGGWGLFNGWGYFLPTRELYDSFEEGDSRREVTILKPGDQFMYFGAQRTFTPAASATTDMQFNKYMEPFSHANPIGVHVSPNGDHGTTDLCVPLLRYAEVLLIKAEAAIALGGAGAGDEELNAIRLRAGLAAKSGMGLDELKKERRNELAGEFADRHRDLVRWGDAQAAYAQPLHNYVGGQVWPARSFNPDVHHIWPVPQREIDNSNGIIIQNEGW